MLRTEEKPRWRHIGIGMLAVSLIGAASQGCSMVDEDIDEQDDEYEADIESRAGAVSSCFVSYDASNDWGTGFVGNVSISNNGGATIDGWNLVLSFGANQRVSQLWNGTYSQNGQKLSVTPASWNKVISPGKKVDFGFVASYSGKNTAPTSFILNGVRCATSVSPGGGQDTGSQDTAQDTTQRFDIPGTIEAEAYHRMSGIATEPCSEGGKNVGWIDVGDFLEFDVNVKTSATYVVTYRVASLYSSGKVELVLDGKTLSSTSIPNTGSWQIWTNITTKATLSSGAHTLRLKASGKLWNINWLRLEKATGDPIDTGSADSDTGSNTPAGSFVEKHGQLRVVGNNLVDKNGTTVQLRGMSSHGLQWYGNYMNRDSIKWLRDDWGMTVVRAAMYTAEGGYISNGSVKSKVFEIVDAAIELGIYVIVDWHILSDNDPNTYKTQAKAFFEEVAAKYKNAPNILYEIANEPNGGNVTWKDKIKPYAEFIVPAIRAIDNDGVIIVGTGTWSQDIHHAADDPLSYSNVMYTLHFYAGTHDSWLRDRIDYARGKGIAIFVTEWGTSDASGNGGPYLNESKQWLDFLDQKKVSWVNWSLCDKNETSAALTSGASTTGGWTSSALSTSGAFVKSRMK